jgi:hypothetical protein
VTGLAVAAAIVVAVGALAGLGTGGHRPRLRLARPALSRSHPARRALAGPVLGGRPGSVVMWPENVGPLAYLAELGTGHVLQRAINIDAGDYDPYLVRSGRWLVYVEGGGGATLTLPGGLRGRPRVLARTYAFAPSVTPGRVWLVRGASWNHGSARSVPVAGGAPGRTVRLPAGTGLIEGTGAGLLLISRRGDLELWTPGRGAPAKLAHLGWLQDVGFAADARLVAYGTGCRILVTTANNGYPACRTLRVRNVVTGGRFSFPAPKGTAGWAPAGFNMDGALAPGDTMIAAEAIVQPRQGLVRVFILRLGGARLRPVAVPRSAGYLPKTAWSSDGRWLLYQGPGRRLWAYRVATGTVRPSRVPCCFYTVMITVPPPPG